MESADWFNPNYIFHLNLQKEIKIVGEERKEEKKWMLERV